MRWTRKLKQRLPLLIAALGACTFWPALMTPRFLDDYLHTLMIDGRFPVARSPFNLYDFVGDPERALFTERGFLPWWAHPELKLRFYRPIASGLLWFEQRVLGLGVALQHVHSFVWWFVAVLAARGLFRRVLSERAALLATLTFAFAPCHAMPLAWVANRNALLSLVFGTLALGFQLDFRREGRALHGLAALALFTLALLSGEYALCFGGYVLALEVTRRGDAWGRRAVGLLTFFLPAAGYLALRHALGYGTTGSGFYVDPLVDPLGFLRIAPFRFAALLSQGWFTLGTDTWLLYGSDWKWLVFPFALFAAGTMIWVLRQVYAALDPTCRSHASWLLLGSLLAVIPVISTVPSPRVMAIALLGIAVQIALVLDHAWFPEVSAPQTRRVEYLGLVATVLGALHFVHGPVTSWLAASTIQRDASRFVSDVKWVGQKLEKMGSSQVIVLRGGVDQFFGPFALVVSGGPWTRWDILTDPGHLLALRRDPRTVDLIVSESDSLIPSGGFSLFRDSDVRFREGEAHHAEGFRLRVLDVGEQGPSRVRVTFDELPGEGQLWVSRKWQRLHLSPPPKVGFGLPSDR